MVVVGGIPDGESGEVLKCPELGRDIQSESPFTIATLVPIDPITIFLGGGVIKQQT